MISDYIFEKKSLRHMSLIIVAPVIFFFLYSGQQVNFIERNFSPLIPVISIISAIGFINVWQYIGVEKLNPTLRATLCLFFISAVFYTPLRLDFYFIQDYIKHSDRPPRTAFQNTLKQDFDGFWIKNVYFTLKITGEIPDKPPKTPRLYQIDDLNEHWTKRYLLLLEANGFRRVGTYCSEFFTLPPNTLTIYHAAAKNHYYVRTDEWPNDIAETYFKTNCK